MIIEHPDPIDARTSLQIHRLEMGEQVLLVVVGEIDHDNVAELRDALVAARPHEVLLDLSPVRFFDAATVNLLVGEAADARSRGARLAITGITPFGRRILQLLAVGQLLSVSDDIGAGHEGT